MTYISIYKNLNYTELIDKLYELKLRIKAEDIAVSDNKSKDNNENLDKDLNELQKYLKQNYKSNYTMLMNLVDNKVNLYFKNNEYLKINNEIDDFLNNSKKNVSEKINLKDFNINQSFNINDYNNIKTKKSDLEKDRRELEEIEKEIKNTLKDLKNTEN